MEFSLEAFKQAPSREALEMCRKTDLYLIADFYDISVMKAARSARHNCTNTARYFTTESKHWCWGEC